MTQHLLAGLSWAGAVVLLYGYAQTSRGRWTGESTVFQACSIFGSATLALAAVSAGAWSSAAVNVVWLVIGAAVVARRAVRPARPAAGTGRGTTGSAVPGRRQHEVERPLHL